MEHFSPEEIQTLIIAEITGDISDQERTYLHRIIAENAQARHLYDDMHKFLDAAEVVQSKNGLGSRIRLGDLTAHVRPVRKKAMLTIGLSVAAMVVLLVGIYVSIKPTDPNVN